MSTKWIVAIVIIVVALIIKIVQAFLKNRISFGGTDEDPMFFAHEDNELMKAASEQARSNLDGFISEMQKTDSDFHGSVKVKVSDNGETEYMWLDELNYSGNMFSGVINNDPQIVGNVNLGDPWKVGKDEVVDWIYQKDGKIYGNFTYKMAIQKWPKEKQVIALKDYGDAESVSRELIHESAPFLSALMKNMKPEDMEAAIEKSNTPEEKKQKLLAKFREKMTEQS